MMNPKLLNRLLFALSIATGITLAAILIIGFGSLTRYSGLSLEMRSAHVAVFLAGLAAGILIGSAISSSVKRDKLLLIFLILSGLLLMAVPLLSNFALNPWKAFSFRYYLFFSVLLLAIPACTLGACVPLIFSNLDYKPENNVRIFSFVVSYLLSGVFLGIIILNLYLIPKIGYTLSAILLGVLNAILPVILLFVNGWSRPGIFTIALLLLAGFSFVSIKSEAGTVSGGSYWEKVESDAGNVLTWMKNGIPVARFSNTSVSNEAIEEFFRSILSPVFPGTEVLLLGQNGSLIPDLISDSELKCILVEPDPQLFRYSSEFFHNDPKIRVIQSDLRRFINTHRATYEIIVADFFRSEDLSYHCLTAEALSLLCSKLKPGGMVILPVWGKLDDYSASALGSIYKTVRSMGLTIDAYRLPDQKDRFLFLMGANRDFIDDHIPEALQANLVPADSVNLRDAIILTDVRPVAESLHRHSARQFRSSIPD